MGNDAQGFKQVNHVTLVLFVGLERCHYRNKKKANFKRKGLIIEDPSAPGFKQSACALKWGVSPACMNKLLRQKKTK